MSTRKKRSLVPRCKLSRKKQGKLIGFFLSNCTARDAAARTRVNRNTATLFFRKLRRIIAARKRRHIGGVVEVDAILDIIGETIKKDPDTGIIYVKRHSDGKILKVADIVDDDTDRLKVMDYLRNIKKLDDIDIIIALGMAKEGFDWPFCEYALTIGYRASLTEVVQIIGRCTRDSENKSHAQFTNLIAQPDAQTQEVSVAVNNMLKAITCSLLMEQVLAPNFNFKTKVPDANEGNDPKTIKIQGFKEPSAKVKRILESNLNEIKAKILQDENVLRTLPSNEVDAEYINKTLIPKIIRETYPDLTNDEVEQLRQWVVARRLRQ